MGGLGYGQSSLDPAQLQAAAGHRQTQRRPHEAEQALAAEWVLRALHTHQPPPQPTDLRYSNSKGNYDGIGYYAYGSTEHYNRFAE